MPSRLQGNWTLLRLLDVTYRYFRNRFDYMDRDVIKGAVTVQRIAVYDGRNPGAARTKFIIKSSSYPQYYPYLTKRDSRGRLRSYQRTYKHNYDVTIQLDRLSINVPVKIRIGANKLYEFNPPKSLIRSKTNPHGKYLSVGDYNINVKGIMPDHFFTQEWVRHNEGCLFGKNYTIRPPRETNPRKIPFLTKHEIWVVKTLLSRGILVDDRFGRKGV